MQRNNGLTRQNLTEKYLTFQHVFKGSFPNFMKTFGDNHIIISLPSTEFRSLDDLIECPNAILKISLH